MSSGIRSGSQHLKNSRPSFGSQVSDSFLRRHRLKYLGLILQRYGLVEGTPDNETPSLFLYMFVVPDPSFILKAMATGALNLDSVISHRLPAARMKEAYELAKSHDKSLMAAVFDWRVK